MRLYRCYNEDCADDEHGRLGFDFETEGDAPPACPKCKTDGREADGKRLIVPRVVIHLLAKDAAGPIRTGHGRRRWACQPESKELPKRCTAETAAVNCPACRGTALFKALHAERQAVDENEVPAGTPIG